MEGFVLSDTDVPDALEICRGLDGMPLALELAAAQVEVFGIKGLAAVLEDRLAVLTRGRRTGLPRHQTLRATIDWSYDLLSPAEQAVLRRAAVFTGDFVVDFARLVCGGNGLTGADVLVAVANLVEKSLVATDISGETTSYRLLDTTRACAFDKLAASGELERIRRLHAEAMRDLFRQADAEVATGATDEWREKYGPQVGNRRSALDWAFSPGGDATLGVALAAAATNSWIALALLGECCYWGAWAIAKLGTAEGTHDNMVLQCGVGLALLLSKGPTPQAYDSLTEARALSESLDDTTCQLRAIYGLWLLAIRTANFREALAIAREYGVLAETFLDGVVSPMAGHMLGISRFCLGENASAAVDLEQAGATYATSAGSGDAIHLGVT
jgi:hypothetical protein